MCFSKKSRERPRSTPYLRLNKTRRPLFLQLETTKALNKLKNEEKKISNFFNFFKVSGKSDSAAKCKRGFWDFLNIHSVAKYQKIDGGPFGATKKISEKNEKFEQSHSAEKWGKIS